MMQSRRATVDGETEQTGETEEEEGRRGENKDFSRYSDVVSFLLQSDWSMDALLCLCVDNAYSCDPRVKRFKEQEKEEKEAKKRAKREAARQEALERERVRWLCV